MNFFSASTRNRSLLAVIAGLLLAASFPKIGIAGFAWLAPGLMLLAAMGCNSGDAFRVGYIAGLAFYLSALYWLLLIPVKWFPLLGWVALAAYLALFPATWLWLMTKWLAIDRQPSALDGKNVFLVTAFEKLSSASWTQRTIWCVSGAATWVALEMLLARLFSGFPWLLLGLTQHPILPLAQIASLTGVYGLSFLVVWTSLALVCATAIIIARPTLRGAWMGEIIFPLIAIVAALTFGFHQLSQRETPAREIKVTFVQPSIPQTMIWDETENANRFQMLLALTERALDESKPDLLLWPEAAVPEMLRYHSATFKAVTELARKHKVWFIVGSDDKEPKKNSSKTNAAVYFNCSFLISPNGELISRYRKQQLVVFGEYVPLARWLPFMKYFTPVQGSYESGDGPVTFEMPDLRAKTSVLICFEDVFPHLTRKYVSRDTDFLVNLTNDGWFGEGAEQWQHAVSGAFRAIENGIPLLRCCNNGLTCWIDSNGRFQKIFTDANQTTYSAGFMSAQIPFLSEIRSQTFYNRRGDLFGWGCVAFTFAVLSRRAIARKTLLKPDSRPD